MELEGIVQIVGDEPVFETDLLLAAVIHIFHLSVTKGCDHLISSQAL